MRARVRQAVFFDRDGTLIRDEGYLCDPGGVVPLPGAGGALRRLRAAGYLLFLFTNQSGIGRGRFPAEAAEACNREAERRLGLAPGFDGVCIAPEAPGDPPVYRKPSPRFILETVRGRNLDPARSWMVGDKESDVEAGLRAGVRAARILPDRAGETSGAVPVFPDVGAFADWLLAPVFEAG
ncbi:MAG: D-glycero-alpha-D-manno-heptose-1,7-bisphosphate 7-phosphatase [Puniceicoccaceae bacterium]